MYLGKIMAKCVTYQIIKQKQIPSVAKYVKTKASIETFLYNMARLCCGPDDCNRNTVSFLGWKAYF
jgi:hypothetical protein